MDFGFLWLLVEAIGAMKKVVKKGKLSEYNAELEDLTYWLSRPPEERVAAVDFLRAQFNGRAERLQRIARALQREER